MADRFDFMQNKGVPLSQLSQFASSLAHFPCSQAFKAKVEACLGEQVSQEETPQEEEESFAAQICRTIDENFEQGILMVRQMENNPAADMQTKQAVFAKLLSMIVLPSHTQDQKVQQAYSLKALMWMKQQIFGIEETFRTTDQVMLKYGLAKLSERESSVELYLLNFWTTDLSMRDLCDRINTASNTQEVTQKLFTHLFDWLMS
jgi:hypothetical protein